MTPTQKAQRSIFLRQLEASTKNIVGIYQLVLEEANRILLSNPTAKTRASIDAIIQEYDLDLVNNNELILSEYNNELSTMGNLGGGHITEFISANKTELDIDDILERFNRVISESVRELITTVYPDGLMLSQRLWRPEDRLKIAQTILRGYQEGTSPFELAERIMETADGTVFSNAYRVAHTELVRVYSKAKFETARDWNNRPDSEFEIYIRQELSHLHPVWDICFTNWNTKIYTEDGWKPIAHIKKGERVLTHKGKMQKVNKVYKNVVHEVEETTIGYTCRYDGRKRTKKITATSNHPFLVNGYWKRISDIKIGDNVRILASRCKECGEIIPHYRRFCSKSCASRYSAKKQWQDDNHRENISKKRKELIEENGGEIPWLKDWVESGGSTEVLLREETKKNNRIAIDKKMQEMVDNGTHPFQQEWVHTKAMKALGGKNRGGSFIERKIAWLLESMGIEFERQYKIDRSNGSFYYGDFYLPEYNLILECDGEYWHIGKEREDLERQTEIEELGYQVIRLWGNDIRNDLEKCAKRIARITSNHNDKYLFMDAEITLVEHKSRTQSTPITKYNLSVENDNTYVAKGFVVHNCDVLAGDYSTDDFVPEIPRHPNCLCTEVEVLRPRKLATVEKQLDKYSDREDEWGVARENVALFNKPIPDDDNSLLARYNRAIENKDRDDAMRVLRSWNSMGRDEKALAVKMANRLDEIGS